MEGFFLWHWLFGLVVLGTIIGFVSVPPYWGLKNAGWNGWWCLLFAVPVVNVIFLWVFAFAKWENDPNARHKDAPRQAALG